MNTKPTVYVETTVISYLAAWPSRDLIRAAHQRITREWWEGRRDKFSLHISQLVLEEISRGDPTAVSDRLKELKDVPILATPSDSLRIAKELMRASKLPANAQADALHLAIAAYHGINFLLTWNCRHINNVEFRDEFASACEVHGFACPKICTPEELLGDRPMKDDAIVEEVRAVRQKLFAEFNYDLSAMIADLQKKEKIHGERVVNLRASRDSKKGKAA
jgi:predicted nucleic acid-binding protein